KGWRSRLLRSVARNRHARLLGNFVSSGSFPTVAISRGQRSVLLHKQKVTERNTNPQPTPFGQIAREVDPVRRRPSGLRCIRPPQPWAPIQPGIPIATHGTPREGGTIPK